MKFIAGRCNVTTLSPANSANSAVEEKPNQFNREGHKGRKGTSCATPSSLATFASLAVRSRRTRPARGIPQAINHMKFIAGRCNVTTLSPANSANSAVEEKPNQFNRDEAKERASLTATGRRHQPLDAHVGDDVAIVFTIMHQVERQRAESRGRVAEQLDRGSAGGRGNGICLGTIGR